MKLGLLLIALGVGYWVYADASKEKGNLRSLGQWVGAIIMATSLVSGAFLLYAYSTGGCPGKGGWRPFKHCPFHTSLQAENPPASSGE